MSRWELDPVIVKGVKDSIARREAEGFTREEVRDDVYGLSQMQPAVEQVSALPWENSIALIGDRVDARTQQQNARRDAALIRFRYPFIRPGETEVTWKASREMTRDEFQWSANRVRDAHDEGMDIIDRGFEEYDAEKFGDMYEQVAPQVHERRLAATQWAASHPLSGA